MKSSPDQLQRLHGIWALGQTLRSTLRPLAGRGDTYLLSVPESGRALFDDKDADVRTASLRIYGAVPVPFDSEMTRLYVGKLQDPSPRVRLVAAQGLGFCGGPSAVQPLLDLARREQDKSQEMRHVISWSLAQLSLRSEEAWKAVVPAAKDNDAAVRIVVLQAAAHVARNPRDWCRNAADVVAGFLKYEELLPEVARLINDRGLEQGRTGTIVDQVAGKPPVVTKNAMPVLGICAEDSRDPMTRLRGLNALFRAGGQAAADNLMMALMQPEHPMPSALAVEALKMLAAWPSPPKRDQVHGRYRPVTGAHDRAAALSALLTLTRDVIVSDPTVTMQTLETIRTLKAGAWSSFVADTAGDSKLDARLRALALHVLSDLGSPLLPDALKKAIADSSSTLRIAAAGLLGKTDPVLAAKGLAAALTEGSPEDHRAAFTELAALHSPEADKLLTDHLTLLAAGKVPAIARLELIEAAKKREAPAVKAALAAYEASLPKDDLLAKYAVSLEGGDVENGKRLFKEHPVAACQRCHQVNKAGGEAGPPLDGIASRKDRRYLLESIVNPNAVIADTFRMLVCTMKDGSIQAGVIQSETAASLTLQQPGDQPVTLNTADIAKREPVPSGMLPGLGELLTPRELRDLVEYCASLKADP